MNKFFILKIYLFQNRGSMCFQIYFFIKSFQISILMLYTIPQKLYIKGPFWFINKESQICSKRPCKKVSYEEHSREQHLRVYEELFKTKFISEQKWILHWSKKKIGIHRFLFLIINWQKFRFQSVGHFLSLTYIVLASQSNHFHV